MFGRTAKTLVNEKRKDGTAVYITQDIGTASLRYDDYGFDKMIYVVGNEQNHHFNVLFKILKILPSLSFKLVVSVISLDKS